MKNLKTKLDQSREMMGSILIQEITENQIENIMDQAERTLKEEGNEVTWDQKVKKAYANSINLSIVYGEPTEKFYKLENYAKSIIMMENRINEERSNSDSQQLANHLMHMNNVLKEEKSQMSKSINYLKEQLRVLSPGDAESIISQIPDYPSDDVEEKKKEDDSDQEGKSWDF